VPERKVPRTPSAQVEEMGPVFFMWADANGLLSAIKKFRSTLPEYQVLFLVEAFLEERKEANGKAQP